MFRSTYINAIKLFNELPKELKGMTFNKNTKKLN